MNAQTLTCLSMICSTFFMLTEKASTPAEPIYASSLDYGFDFDQEEIGRELLAPLPASLSPQTTSEEEANEYEVFYGWLIPKQALK